MVRPDKARGWTNKPVQDFQIILSLWRSGQWAGWRSLLLRSRESWKIESPLGHWLFLPWGVGVFSHSCAMKQRSYWDDLVDYLGNWKVLREHTVENRTMTYIIEAHEKHFPAPSLQHSSRESKAKGGHLGLMLGWMSTQSFGERLIFRKDTMIKAGTGSFKCGQHV